MQRFTGLKEFFYLNFCFREISIWSPNTPRTLYIFSDSPGFVGKHVTCPIGGLTNLNVSEYILSLRSVVVLHKGFLATTIPQIQY